MASIEVIEPKNILNDNRRKNWFWDFNDVFSSDLSHNAKLVRLYLARCANGDRQAWPSFNTIAKYCGVSRPTAIKAVAELEQKCWIKKTIRVRKNGEHESTIYTLMDPPAETKSETNEGGGKGDLPPVNSELEGKEEGSKIALPPVKNITAEKNENDGGGVKQVYQVVNSVDNVVKPVDPNNTKITIHNNDNLSITPSPNQDNYILGHPVCDVERTDGKKDTTDQHCSEPSLTTERLINEICFKMNATPAQVKEAIRRANEMSELGKVKSNYIGLVYAITNTVVQEDALKGFGKKGINPQEVKKKSLVRGLYFRGSKKSNRNADEMILT